MYWSFIVKRENYDTNFSKFIKLKIAQNTSYIITIDKIPFKIKDDSFRNVFYYENYEINIEKINLNTYEINIYPIRECNKISYNFGCELETCLDLYCSKYSRLSIKDKLSKINKEKENELKYWYELLSIYIKDVIIPNTNKKFLELYPYAYIALHPKSGYSDYIIDMSNGEIKEKIAPIYYSTIIFTRDASLICADTISDFFDSDKFTLHCEIVTPILSSYEELFILYNTLIKPGCLNANDSTAFHINISLYDDNNKPIYFSYGFIDKFLDEFEEFENENIARFDNKENKYAMKLHNYSEFYTLAKYKDMIYYDDNKQYTYENFIEGEKFYRCYINLNEKYNTIHKKSPTLLEFRLFPSKDNKEDLLEYLNSTFKIMNDSYTSYCVEYKNIIENLQSKNLQAKIDYNKVEFFEGSLFYEDDNFNEFKNVNPYKQNELMEGIQYFFMKRNQKIFDYKKIENKAEYMFRILSISTKEIDEYQIRINKDKSVTIKLSNNAE
jgi:hypothetical protein